MILAEWQRGSPDGKFPQVDWIEGWPRDRSRSAVIVPVVLAGFFSALAVTPVLGVSWDSGPVVVLGSSGGVLAFIGLAYFFASLLFEYLPRRNPGITPYNDDAYGSGIRLDVDRIESTRLLPALTGMSVYGFCGWLDWRAGGGVLLSISKSNTGGATASLVLSVTLGCAVLFFVALSKWGVQVCIHPSGIVRRLSVPFGKGKEEFVSWQDVSTLGAGMFSSGKAKNLPLLEFHLSDSSVPARDKMFDRPGIFGVPLHGRKCDPNSLLSIMEFLHEHPARRDLLTCPEVPHWFLRVERCGK